MFRTLLLYITCFIILALFLLGMFMSIPGVGEQLWDGVAAIVTGRYR